MHGLNELKSINEKAARSALKKKQGQPKSLPKPSAELEKYLEPLFPVRGEPKEPTEADLKRFKRHIAARPDNAHKRAKRQDIKKWFGKSVAELTLDEWKDYQRPSFHAPEYLKELWTQLTPAEQDLVKQCNEWAFNFPATFDTDEQFLRACASRLERFFGRKFRVKRTGTKGNGE